MKTLLVLTLLTFSLFSKSQTWSLVYSTDSTHISYFLDGPNKCPTFYGTMRCENCPQKGMFILAELKNNAWTILNSYDITNVIPDYQSCMFSYINKDSLIAWERKNLTFYHSNDGGKSWVKLFSDSAQIWPLFVNIDRNKSICLSDEIVIFENGGNSYRKIPSNFLKKYPLNINIPPYLSYKGSSIYWLKPYPIRNNTDTTTFDLLHSRDNGETWTVTPVPIKFKPWSYSNLCVTQTKENEGYISVTGPINSNSQYDYLVRFKNDSVLASDHIIIDSLSKNNWLAITGIHFYNNCEGVITTFHDYHYKTADGGISWVKTTQAPGYQFNQAVFFDSTCVLYDGGFNGSIQKTPLIVNYTNGGPPYPSQTGCIVKAPVGIEYSTHPEVTVFPNPFENEIKLVLPNVNEAFEVRLYNATGQLLADYPSMRLQNTINTSQLAHGFYLLSISNSQYNYNFKLLK